METEIDSTHYEELIGLVRSAYGYDFSDYAKPTVVRRICHFMQGKKIESVVDLGQLLSHDELLFEEFVQDMSVTVTEMFRDPSFFKSLRDNVVKRLATYPVVKIWAAGCATGEEVYSLAILLKEEGLLDRSIIYATDINQKSLQTAREGIYSLQGMQTYTTSYIQSGGKASFSEYYKAKYDSVLFDKSLRQKIVFASHNLAMDQCFNEFQLILCRNVVMYFNKGLQDRVINLFFESLCSFGFLGLGDKESLLFASRRTCFEEIDRKSKIYMKIS